MLPPLSALHIIKYIYEEIFNLCQFHQFLTSDWLILASDELGKKIQIYC